MNKKKMMDEFLQWRVQNGEIKKWFDQHTILLSNKLNEKAESVEKEELKIFIMGSRRWDLSYPESDIDAVIISNEKENSENIMNILDNFYKSLNPLFSIKRIKTLAGLHLLTIENFTDDELQTQMKLEYTIQTSEQNQKIVDHVSKALSAMTDEEKCQYAHNMRQCFLNKDEEGKIELKKWLRCL